MIPRSRAGWQAELGRAVTSPAELLKILDLDAALLSPAVRAAQTFPLCVPRGFVQRMESGNPNDPLLRQVLPLGAELVPQPTTFSADPVGDLDAAARPGLLHKYHGRALLIATGACAIHCRYCFRRHFPYGDHTQGRLSWETGLAHVRADPSIHEVILSGGDPLLLDDGRLKGLVDAIGALPHVRRLRIHTRLPVVLPERVTPALAELLGQVRFNHPVIVLHVNHANEIDARVRHGCAILKAAGGTLLNQSVLLRGVNDNADTLASLSESLFDAGVLPYYLHLLDRVAGAAHFEVPEDKALQIHECLRTRLPGYLLPRLVRDAPGAAAKYPPAPC